MYSPTYSEIILNSSGEFQNSNPTRTWPIFWPGPAQYRAASGQHTYFSVLKSKMGKPDGQVTSTWDICLESARVVCANVRGTRQVSNNSSEATGTKPRCKLERVLQAPQLKPVGKPKQLNRQSSFRGLLRPFFLACTWCTGESLWWVELFRASACTAGTSHARFK